jgi:chromosome partitioning protein
MALIITCAGQKGGAGKTTFAVNLAELFRLDGKKTVLFDCDPQASARKWKDLAEQQGHLDAVSVVGISGGGLRSAIEERAETQVIVIDTPPRMSVEARQAILYASIILVPVAPGPTDVWALEETLQTLQDVRATRIDGGPCALAVTNRGDKRSGFSAALPASMVRAGFEAATATVFQRSDYVKSMAMGQSVLTYGPKGKAADEIRELSHEVVARAMVARNQESPAA